MTDAGNPLVAARTDSTEWYSGLGIVESIADTVAGVESGGWIDPAIGGVSTGLDALSVVVDPLGSLVSWGVAWLLEHVKPLSDALDWLAGDPDQITAFAQTWRNVAANTADTATAYADAVAAQVAGWLGSAADAYRAHAGEQVQAMTGIATAAGGIGSVVEGAGLLVALVRELVRDAIADFVSVLAVRPPTWLAEVGLTLGIASPVVIAQVGALVARWAERITGLVQALLSSLRRLGPLLGRLGTLIDELQAVLARLARRDATTPGGASGDGPDSDPALQTGAEVRRPRSDLDFEVTWADEAYDAIRASDDDIEAIARTAGERGFTADDIGTIKNHVFREEHVLDMYPPPTTARFDANPRMAEAWLRLTQGNPHPADYDLLAHELYEARYMRDTGDPSYSRAHRATLDAGYGWDPDAAAADGVGYQGRG